MPQGHRLVPRRCRRQPEGSGRGKAVIAAPQDSLPLPLETPPAQRQTPTLGTTQAVRFPLHFQSSRLASTVDHGPLNPKPHVSTNLVPQTKPPCLDCPDRLPCCVPLMYPNDVHSIILFPKATLPSGLHNRRSLEISFGSGKPPRRFLQNRLRMISI